MKKKQKTVWITGASSGIGLAFAKAYAEKGISPDLNSKKTGASGKISRKFRGSLSD